MHEETSARDLKERLALIESMIAEGRRRTERWGWAFLLWGVAYMVALAWATWGRTIHILSGSRSLAWPVTMIGAVVLTIVIGVRQGKGEPGTTIGRAVFSVWVAVGTSMILLFPALAFSGRLEPHAFVAAMAAMLAVANAASGMILRWRMQLACAVVWWVTSVAACFGSDAQLLAVFVAALFLCQIVFGVYAMILEARRRGKPAVAHA